MLQNSVSLRCPSDDHVRCGSVVIRHEQFFTAYRPAVLCEFSGYVVYSGSIKNVGGIWMVNTRERHLCHLCLSVEVG